MPKEEGGRELEKSARIRDMEQAWDMALQHSGRKTAVDSEDECCAAYQWSLSGDKR